LTAAAHLTSCRPPYLHSGRLQLAESAVLDHFLLFSLLTLYHIHHHFNPSFTHTHTTPSSTLPSLFDFGCLIGIDTPIHTLHSPYHWQESNPHYHPLLLQLQEESSPTTHTTSIFLSITLALLQPQHFDTSPLHTYTHILPTTPLILPFLKTISLSLSTLARTYILHLHSSYNHIHSYYSHPLHSQSHFHTPYLQDFISISTFTSTLAHPRTTTTTTTHTTSILSILAKRLLLQSSIFTTFHQLHKGVFSRSSREKGLKIIFGSTKRDLLGTISKLGRRLATSKPPRTLLEGKG